MVYPEQFEVKIGFDQIRDLLRSSCTTPMGFDLVEHIVCSTDADEINKSLSETGEFLQVLLMERSFDWSEVEDIQPILQRTRIIGTYLYLEECLIIRDNLQAIRKTKNFFDNTKPELYPTLKKIVQAIQLFPFIQEQFDRIISKQGHVKDNASKELSIIRSSRRSKQAGISKRLTQLIHTAKAEGWIEEDSSPTMREGRLLIPVPVTHKRRINGLIIDQSATGKTVFVEPIEIIEVNNEIRELEISEQAEIVKILSKLTELIRPYYDEIQSWSVIIGRLDFIRSKAIVSKKWDGCKIEVSDACFIDWRQARHPLLILNKKFVTEKVVPQDIILTEEDRLLLISGPNAGGKSVCLKTTGLIQYMIQSGLLPPVKEGSSSGIFQHYFIDIGDEQSIENDLSTYSSHLQNMKTVLRDAGPGSLVLIDEFGSGTEPQLGAAIAESILKRLIASGVSGIITTHYSNLKHLASSADGILNAAMLYDSQGMKPLFELEIGKPGSSFAFEIARKIGLPNDVLADAEQDVGTDYLQFEKHLKEITRDKRYWENKRKRIRQSEKKLEKLLEEYEKQIADLERKNKELIREKKQQTDLLLGQINKKVENTIQEIRKEQADKEKTRKARSELEKLQSEVRSAISEKEAAVKKEIEGIRSKHDLVKARFGKKELTKPELKDEVLNYHPGTKVRFLQNDSVGEVIRGTGSTVFVALGQLIITVSPDQIRPITETEFNKDVAKAGSSKGTTAQDIQQRRLTFTSNIDIRGARGEEAILMVRELIDEAIMLGETDLRILHGKGNGVLRQLVREYLATVDVVKQYADEDIRFGGSGITNVTLEF